MVSYAQIHVGIAGGGSLTHGFQSTSRPEDLTTLLSYPTHRDYLVGPTLEVDLPRKLAVEVDALYRPLNFTNASRLADGTLRSISPATVVTWEFPIILKYRFGDRRWRPEVGGGVAFRTQGNVNNTSPSDAGIAAALSVQGRFGPLRITPSLRYTRWKADPTGIFLGYTKQDQLTVLIGFSIGKR